MTNMASSTTASRSADNRTRYASTCMTPAPKMESEIRLESADHQDSGGRGAAEYSFDQEGEVQYAPGSDVKKNRQRTGESAESSNRHLRQETTVSRFDQRDANEAPTGKRSWLAVLGDAIHGFFSCCGAREKATIAVDRRPNGYHAKRD